MLCCVRVGDARPDDARLRQLVRNQLTLNEPVLFQGDESALAGRHLALVAHLPTDGQDLDTIDVALEVESEKHRLFQ